MSSINYYWFGLLITLLTACEPDDGTQTCQDQIVRSWQVSEYTVGGQQQSTQNVRVGFTDENYTLVLPEVSVFSSEGTWEVNEDCSRVTLTDSTGETIVVSVSMPEDNAMTLSFSYTNFKSEPVSYLIVLTNS